MREIVEGFFFRRLRTEDGTRIRRLLVKSPPGLGKMTEVIDWHHLRQIGFRPQVTAPQTGRNPRKFHTAVSDIVSSSEPRPARHSWSEALVRHGAREALAEVLGVSANHIQLKDPLDGSSAISPCRRGQAPQS